MEYRKIAIIGASNDRTKYGNKAVRAYVAEGMTVYPINPNETQIEGIACFRSILDIPDEVEMASLYLPPAIGIRVLDEIARKGVKELLINHGAESPELLARAEELGINYAVACSIVAIGRSPGEFGSA